MKTLAELNAEISALEGEREALTRAERAEEGIAWQSLTIEYNWSVTWPHPAQFRVERTATPETAERIAAHKAKFPTTSGHRKAFEGGMQYSVLEGGYVIGGGGSVILRFPGETIFSSFDPQPVSADILAALREGRIPVEIRRD